MPGCTCRRHAAETKAKVSAAAKATYANGRLFPVAKTKGRLGVPWSAEERKLREACKPENPGVGKSLTVETERLRKISEGLKAAHANGKFAAAGRKGGATRKGVPWSAEHKAAHAAALARPGTRAKMREAKLTRPRTAKQIAYDTSREGRPGHVFTPEERQRISNGVQASWAAYTEPEFARRIDAVAAALRKRPNRLEARVHEVLMAFGVEFRSEVRFGRYIVDVYIEEANLAIEIDGDYWHKNSQETDFRKDCKLSDLGLIVRRVREQDIRKDAVAVVQELLTACNVVVVVVAA